MYFARYAVLLLLAAVLTGCGDNLFPSGQDNRPPVTAGTTGGLTTQKAPAFSVRDIQGNTVTRDTALAGKKGIVIYFTMWCPICDSHMSHMRPLVDQYRPDVTFYAVDYVSATVNDSAVAASANGWANNGYVILADTGHAMQGAFQGTMGTTVVIDKDGIVRMNEDFGDGSRLQAALAVLQ